MKRCPRGRRAPPRVGVDLRFGVSRLWLIYAVVVLAIASATAMLHWCGKSTIESVQVSPVHSVQGVWLRSADVVALGGDRVRHDTVGPYAVAGDDALARLVDSTFDRSIVDRSLSWTGRERRGADGETERLYVLASAYPPAEEIVKAHDDAQRAATRRITSGVPYSTVRFTVHAPQEVRVETISTGHAFEIPLEGSRRVTGWRLMQGDFRGETSSGIQTSASVFWWEWGEGDQLEIRSPRVLLQ